MSFPLSIVIWDYDPERIAEIDRNLHLALRELNLRVQPVRTAAHVPRRAGRPGTRP